jgi:hypothetical protein
VDFSQARIIIVNQLSSIKKASGRKFLRKENSTTHFCDNYYDEEYYSVGRKVQQKGLSHGVDNNILL